MKGLSNQEVEKEEIRGHFPKSREQEKHVEIASNKFNGKSPETN